MNTYARMIRNLKTPPVIEKLNMLYGSRNGTLVSQSARYIRVIKHHEELFNAKGEILLVSAPGRTEIGGNHTDHNNGKVLAASVNLDTLCAVSKREDNKVSIVSDGYPRLEMDLSDISVQQAEKETTAALIRGVAAKMSQSGYQIGGFEAVVTSEVVSGGGLSSSAAFEVMICAVFDALFNQNNIEFTEQARIAQYAENVYFGKPSGLLDQMASASGGLVFIDFKCDNPKIKSLKYDFAQKGYTMVVVNTGGSHANLTEHYAAIPHEMKQVAAHFGEKSLRCVRPEQVMAEAEALKSKVSDRAIIRALHFFNENDRVQAQVDALESDDLKTFFHHIIESGRSSFMYLQNVYTDPEHQPLALALALAEQMLRGKGAWRVHGGGFAGTTLNFVPVKELDKFINEMESVFGRHSCHILDIRPQGAAVLKL